MRYNKTVVDRYVMTIGTGIGGTEEIQKSEYDLILEKVNNIPQNEGKYYKLRNDDFTWEEFDMPPMPEEEMSAEEALALITGGEI